jgi:O-methyltransferase
MVPPRWFVDNVELVARQTKVPGDIVECGCWNGGMSAAMAAILPGRRSVMFDSFEGLPEPSGEDGDRAKEWADPLVADEATAGAAMRASGSHDVEIRRGWFEDTVPRWAAEGRPISVLRLDGDWYKSTRLCLEFLFPLLSHQGLVIIDDYYVWDGCARAVHEYLLDGTERLCSTPNHVAYIRRGDPLLRGDGSF